MTPPDWWIERGIGETRMARVEDGEIVEARVLLDEASAAGSVFYARLIDVGRNGRNAVAEKDGSEFLLPRAPTGVSEGEKVRIEVTREAIPGAEPWKRPLARAVKAGHQRKVDVPGSTIAFPAPHDPLEKAGWSDLIEEARSGIVRFAGGELRISPTPAMTLIDVDGVLAPAELARAGAEAAARTILRHGIGGSIGVDFPTVEGKAERKAIAEAVDRILPQPFERTAVNGFGFLQIVRPRRHASLFELAADRAPFEARALLRRAARETGAIRLVASPAVITVLEGKPAWIDQLARQVGGGVGLRADPKLTMSGGHAEKV